MGSTNERSRYNVTPLIGQAHTQNDPCFPIQPSRQENVFVTTDLINPVIPGKNTLVSKYNL